MATQINTNLDGFDHLIRAKAAVLVLSCSDTCEESARVVLLDVLEHLEAAKAMLQGEVR